MVTCYTRSIAPACYLEEGCHALDDAVPRPQASSHSDRFPAAPRASLIRVSREWEALSPLLPARDEPYHAAFGDLDLVVVANQVALKGVEEHESPRILY